MQPEPLHPLNRPPEDPPEPASDDPLRRHFHLTDEALSQLRAGQLPLAHRVRQRNQSLISMFAVLFGLFMLRVAEYRGTAEEYRIGQYFVIALAIGSIYAAGNWLYFTWRWRRQTVVTTAGLVQYEPQRAVEKLGQSARTLYVGGQTLKAAPEDVKVLPEGAWLRVYWLASSCKIVAAEPLTREELSHGPGGPHPQPPPTTAPPSLNTDYQGIRTDGT